MAHPFFETIAYPWKRQEAGPLFDALKVAIPNPTDIDRIYKASADPGEELPMLALAQPPDAIWKNVLEHLAAHGGLRKLCETFAANFKSSEPVQTAVRNVMNAQSALELKIIDERILLLDRKNLRTQIALLEPEESPIKVLLVRGGARTGKSWSRHIFRRVARDNGAKSVYLYAPGVATVGEVINELFSALQASDQVPAQGDTTPEAWYRAVCIRLQAIVSKAGQPLWIAVDDLGPASDGTPLLDSTIRDFFDILALKMPNPTFYEWFRLMLIHYPDDIPTNWRHEFWSEDRTSDQDVAQTDIEELIKSWSLPHRPKIIQDDVTKLAVEIISKVDAPPVPGQQTKPRLQRLHDALSKTLQDLMRSPA